MTATKKDDGGSAFPRTGAGNAGTSYDVPAQDGMSLRDYFAAKAMQIAWTRIDIHPISDLYQRLARSSYAVADAMLKARAEGKSNG